MIAHGWVSKSSIARTPSGMRWSPDGTGLHCNVESVGTRDLYFVSRKGEVKVVTKRVHVLTMSDLGKNVVAVGTATSPLKPNDIATFDARTPVIKQLTDVNGDVVAGMKLATTEEVWNTSVDGYQMQGWIVKPADFDPSKTYSLTGADGDGALQERVARHEFNALELHAHAACCRFRRRSRDSRVTLRSRSDAERPNTRYAHGHISNHTESGCSLVAICHVTHYTAAWRSRGSGTRGWSASSARGAPLASRPNTPNASG